MLLAESTSSSTMRMIFEDNWCNLSRGILRDVSFQKMTDKDWDLVYRVHLKGSYSVSKAGNNIQLSIRSHGKHGHTFEIKDMVESSWPLPLVTPFSSWIQVEMQQWDFMEILDKLITVLANSVLLDWQKLWPSRYFNLNSTWNVNSTWNSIN